MSRREDPIAPGRGRGSGRNRFESGRGRFRDRRLSPEFGAYLDYAPGLNTNISYISILSTKIKEYVNTVCESQVGCIFGSNGTVEDYHVYVEPEEDEQTPDLDCLTKKKNLEKWELGYSEFFKFSQKLEIEKRKVFKFLRKRG